MRKLFSSLFVLLLAATALVAQSGEDAYKDARKAFDKYQVNSADMEALVEAASQIDVAMQDAAMKADEKALMEAGDIYSAAINEYIKKRTLDASAKDRVIATPAVRAAKAYMAAYNVSEKKGTQKKALKALADLQANISNEGIYAIQDGGDDEKYYQEAYTAFNTNLMVADFLKEQKAEMTITEELLTQDKFYAALAANQVKDYDNAQRLMEDLYADKYDDAAIYANLHSIYLAKGETEKAEKILFEGRERYADDTNLLFNEINYLLKNERLDELTDRVEQAIQKEPTNMSLYATSANVYEQLYNKALEDGDEQAAEGYYAKAQGEYERGLKQDPSSAQMTYGLGILIYNRGALMSKDLEDLSSDLSKEGEKKYNALKEKVDAQFALALPYFQKSEMQDPNNRNALIALKEMYARRDNYEVSGEMKKRLDKIEAGGSNDSSYFKENGM